MSRIIEVHIDRLALRGVDPLDRQALAQGLKAELSRILADPASQAALSKSRRTPTLRVGRIPLEHGPSGSRKFGGGLARAIGKGMQP
jgi:hypothetical protein